MQGIARTVVLAAVAILVAASATGWAEVPQRVTFTKDVLPILQENCQNCHRPSGANLSGMIAPMSFMNYDETRPWAKAIAKTVNELSMPPWGAAPD